MSLKNDISVLIAEDHLLFSEGVKIILENTGRFSWIGQAQNGKTAVALALREKPSIVLMDIAMPEMDGLEAAKRIKQDCPTSKIVMLTSFTDSGTVRKALSSGVDGYCSKEVDFRSLINVIDMVLQGAVYLDPAIAQFVLNDYFKRKPYREPAGTVEEIVIPGQSIENLLVPPERKYCQTDHKNASENPVSSKPSGLSMQLLQPRELRILSLIAENHTNMEIAKILGLSPAWIGSYIQTILVKLAVESETQAVRQALEEGVIASAPLLEQDYLD